MGRVNVHEMVSSLGNILKLLSSSPDQSKLSMSEDVVKALESALVNEGESESATDASDHIQITREESRNIAETLGYTLEKTGEAVYVVDRDCKALCEAARYTERQIEQFGQTLNAVLADESVRRALSTNFRNICSQLPVSSGQNSSIQALSQTPMHLLEEQLSDLTKTLNESRSSQGNCAELSEAMYNRIRAQQGSLEDLVCELKVIRKDVNEFNHNLSIFAYSTAAMAQVALPPGVAQAAAAIHVFQTKLIGQLVVSSKKKKIERKQQNFEFIQNSMSRNKKAAQYFSTAEEICAVRGAETSRKMMQSALSIGQHAFFELCIKLEQDLQQDNDKLDQEVANCNDICASEIMKIRISKLSSSKKNQAIEEAREVNESRVRVIQEKKASNELAIADLPKEIHSDAAMAVYKENQQLRERNEAAWGLDTLTADQQMLSKALTEQLSLVRNLGTPTTFYAGKASKMLSSTISALGASGDMDANDAQRAGYLLNCTSEMSSSLKLLKDNYNFYSNAYSAAEDLANKKFQHYISLLELQKDLGFITATDVECFTKKHKEMIPSAIASEFSALLTPHGGSFILFVQPLFYTALIAYQMTKILGGKGNLSPVLDQIKLLHEAVVESHKMLRKDNRVLLKRFAHSEKNIIDKVHKSTVLLQQEIVSLKKQMTMIYYATYFKLRDVDRSIQLLASSLPNAVDEQTDLLLHKDLNIWHSQVAGFESDGSTLDKYPAFKDIVSSIIAVLFGTRSSGHLPLTLSGYAYSMPFNGRALIQSNKTLQREHLERNIPWNSLSLLGHFLDQSSSEIFANVNLLLTCSSFMYMLCESSLRKGLRHKKQPFFQAMVMQTSLELIIREVEKIVCFIDTIEGDLDAILKDRIQTVIDSKQSYDDHIDSVKNKADHVEYSRTCGLLENYISQLQYESAIEDKYLSKKLEESVKSDCQSGVDAKYFFPKAVTIGTVRVYGKELKLLDLMKLLCMDGMCVDAAGGWAIHGQNWAATTFVNFSDGVCDTAHYKTDATIGSFLTSILPISAVVYGSDKFRQLLWNSDTEKDFLPLPVSVPQYGVSFSFQGRRSKHILKNVTEGKYSFSFSRWDLQVHGHRLFDLEKDVDYKKNKQHVEKIYEFVEKWKGHHIRQDAFKSKENYEKFKEEYENSYHTICNEYISYLSENIKSIRKTIESFKEEFKKNEEIEDKAPLYDVLDTMPAIVLMPSSNGSSNRMATFHKKTKANALLYDALKAGVGHFYGEWDRAPAHPRDEGDRSIRVMIKWYFVSNEGHKHHYSTEDFMTLDGIHNDFLSSVTSNDSQDDAEIAFSWSDFILRYFIGANKSSTIGIPAQGTHYLRTSPSCLVEVKELPFVGMEKLMKYIDLPLSLCARDYNTRMQDLLYSIVNEGSQDKEKLQRQLSDEGDERFCPVRSLLSNQDEQSIHIEPSIKEMIELLKNERKQIFNAQLKKNIHSEKSEDLKDTVQLSRVVLVSLVGLFSDKVYSFDDDCISELVELQRLIPDTGDKIDSGAKFVGIGNNMVKGISRASLVSEGDSDETDQHQSDDMEDGDFDEDSKEKFEDDNDDTEDSIESPQSKWYLKVSGLKGVNHDIRTRLNNTHSALKFFRIAPVPTDTFKRALNNLPPTVSLASAGQANRGKLGFLSALSKCFDYSNVIELTKIIQDYIAKHDLSSQRSGLDGFTQQTLLEGDLNLTFIKGICRVVYALNLYDSDSPNHKVQMHVLHIKNDEAHHYIFGSLSTGEDELPQQACMKIYGKENKLVHLVCDKKHTWEISSNNAPHASSASSHNSTSSCS